MSIDKSSVARDILMVTTNKICQRLTSCIVLRESSSKLKHFIIFLVPFLSQGYF